MGGKRIPNAQKLEENRRAKEFLQAQLKANKKKEAAILRSQRKIDKKEKFKRNVQLGEYLEDELNKRLGGDLHLTVESDGKKIVDILEEKYREDAGNGDCFALKHCSVANGKVCPIDQRLFLIGRYAKMNMVIPNNAVSEVHCAIFRCGKKYFVKDMSINGTFLNGKRIVPEQEVPLRCGDILAISDPASPFRFEVIEWIGRAGTEGNRRSDTRQLG